MVEQETSIARGIEEREGKLVWSNLRVRYDEKKDTLWKRGNAWF